MYISGFDEANIKELEYTEPSIDIQRVEKGRRQIADFGAVDGPELGLDLGFVVRRAGPVCFFYEKIDMFVRIQQIRTD